MNDRPTIEVPDPWAQAIIWGPCRILNREERPDEAIVGERIAVQTAIEWDRENYESVLCQWGFCAESDAPGDPVVRNRHYPGHIIGTVRVVGDYNGPRPFLDDTMLPALIDSPWHDEYYGHTAEEFAHSVEGDPWYGSSTEWAWLLADPEPLDEPREVPA